MKPILSVAFLILSCYFAIAQPCTPLGNETDYGTSNTWIGYVYDNMDFTGYSGYVTEGSPGSPNFDESFGGDDVNYATNGCPVFTSTFSVRYKLTQVISPGTYEFIVGGDDGYRLSLDSGKTWIIDRWYDQSFNTTSVTLALNGTYDMVLEFYENGGGNRVYFSMSPGCSATGTTGVYGTSNTWNGYIYDGTNFNTYKGMVTEGSIASPNFDESFGGDNVVYPTSDCGVQTETFSARYRLTNIFLPNDYIFTVGADDGYRLSLDGGLTWVIDNWGDHAYAESTYSNFLTGSYDMVLEFYENGGGNRIRFDLQAMTVLAIHLVSFTGTEKDKTIALAWEITANSNPETFDIQRSSDGVIFTTIGTVKGVSNNSSGGNVNYQFTDNNSDNRQSFYRLKMKDKDNLTSYSNILHIRSSTSPADLVTIFPSVVRDNQLFIKTKNTIPKASLVLYDMNGRQVQHKNIGSIANGQTVSLALPVTPLSSGQYIVRLLSADECIASQRILIQ